MNPKSTLLAKEKGLVSICIPTFNSERFLRATLESVFSQTYNEIEVVVSDGGSTDSTLELLTRYSDPRLRVVTSIVKLLPWENWNQSISLSRGEYVMLLCHDDVLTPSAIHCLVEVHKLYPKSSATAGNRQLIKEDGSPLRFQRTQCESVRHWSRQSLQVEVFRTGTNPIGEGLCVLWKSNASIGGFSPHWNYYIDLEFWMRLTDIGPIIQVPNVVGAFRVNRASWTAQIGLRVIREVWCFFEFLYRTGEATIPQRIRGCMLAIIQGVTRPVVQNLVNYKPLDAAQFRKRFMRRS